MPTMPVTHVTHHLDSIGMYDAKDATEIKSPQLPFGENVAVATGAVAAQ